MFLPPTLQPEQLPPLTLAYIGDAVYEVSVRNYLLASGITKVDRLHREVTSLVKAAAQAQAAHALEEWLTPEENDILRRGRNAKSGHIPKNANVTDYRYSTGLETLIGYLYLKGDLQRLQEVFRLIMNFFATNQKKQ